ncbi:hypothetical protein ABWI01_06080 [Oceanicaulis alexandrii]|uniref:hypothetical protein n=1 Tax=Oceanicaulis alexandrii TaxID=153233 RepID=UPI0035D022A4
MIRLSALIAAAPLMLAACAPAAQSAPDLFDRLSAYCGQAFEGEVTSEDERDADFASERLVMHVRECGETELRVPFHVGEDRSRTWVITRLAEGGLRLKHDHRHEDGSEDVLTQYGGDTVGPAGVIRADFPADAESQALFEREGIPVSMANVWSITLSEDSFIYALDRPDRHFAVAFDLTEPVDIPPAPWGAE